MTHLEKIKEVLEYANIQKVAKGTGLHPNVIYRIKNGKTNPKYETVKKINDYLTGSSIGGEDGRHN